MTDFYTYDMIIIIKFKKKCKTLLVTFVSCIYECIRSEIKEISKSQLELYLYIFRLLFVYHTHIFNFEYY